MIHDPCFCGAQNIETIDPVSLMIFHSLSPRSGHPSPMLPVRSVQVYLSKYTHTDIYIYVYVHAHTHTHIYICIYVSMYVCMYKYIFTVLATSGEYSNYIQLLLTWLRYSNRVTSKLLHTTHLPLLQPHRNINSPFLLCSASHIPNPNHHASTIWTINWRTSLIVLLFLAQQCCQIGHGDQPLLVLLLWESVFVTWGSWGSSSHFSTHFRNGRRKDFQATNCHSWDEKKKTTLKTSQPVWPVSGCSAPKALSCFSTQLRSNSSASGRWSSLIKESAKWCIESKVPGSRSMWV